MKGIPPFHIQKSVYRVAFLFIFLAKLPFPEGFSNSCIYGWPFPPPLLTRRFSPPQLSHCGLWGAYQNLSSSCPLFPLVFALYCKPVSCLAQKRECESDPCRLCTPGQNSRLSSTSPFTVHSVSLAVSLFLSPPPLWRQHALTLAFFKKKNQASGLPCPLCPCANQPLLGGKFSWVQLGIADRSLQVATFA